MKTLFTCFLYDVKGWKLPEGGDFEALHCQNTRKFIRCRNAEITTISAIKYTVC
jgi:hypothetical protein